MLRVSVVGYGYWGPNLVRNLVQCSGTQPVLICDSSPKQLAKARQAFPFVQTSPELDDALFAKVDAVLIATPPDTHHALAVRCLDAGKHVLIEKPFTQTVEEACDLVARAERAGLVLMVDHTFVYAPAVRRIKQMIEAGDLGEIYCIDSVRINLGLVQRAVNVIWDLAPHDLSIIDYLVNQWPCQVAAAGKSHVYDQEDIAFVTLNYGERLLAGVHVSWLSPVKLRQMVICGSRKSVVFNDLDPVEKVRVYDRRIESTQDPEDQHRILFDYRLGDMWCPHVGMGEPLQMMVQHFAECVATGRRPLTDGIAGLRIVRMLEGMQRSLSLAGRPVPLGLPPLADDFTQRRAA